jgi:hypothetical protein
MAIIAPLNVILLGGGGITPAIGGCERPPGTVEGDGIGMLAPPPFMGVDIGTCPDLGLGTTATGIDGPGVGIGVLLGVPRPPGPMGPTKGVEPAGPGLGMGMGMPVPVGITG